MARVLVSLRVCLTPPVYPTQAPPRHFLGCRTRSFRRVVIPLAGNVLYASPGFAGLCRCGSQWAQRCPLLFRLLIYREAATVGNISALTRGAISDNFAVRLLSTVIGDVSANRPLAPPRKRWGFSLIVYAGSVLGVLTLFERTPRPIRFFAVALSAARWAIA